MDNEGIRPYAHPDEYFLVEMDKEKPKQRYKYRMFEKGADRHLFPIIYFISHSVLLYKFILEGDDVNLDREPDEKGQERKE